MRILYKDDISSFSELLERDNTITVHDKNIKILATEMYKAKNGIAPNILGEFVSIRDRKYNLRKTSDFLKEKENTTFFW